MPTTSSSIQVAVAEFERAIAHGATSPAGRLFALVDLAPHEGLLTRLVQAEGGLLWKSLFDGSPEEALLDAAPVLIELPSQPGKSLQRELIKAERASPSISWLWSRLSFRDLFLHIQPYLDAEMPDGKRALFRFYDPRTLISIRAGLGHDDIGRTLFAPIAKWWVWRPDGYRDLLEGMKHA